MNASDHSGNCESAQDAIEHGHRTGRLCPEEWDDAELTDPAIALPAHYFERGRLDRMAAEAGEGRAVVLDAELAPHFVDAADIDPAGWVS